MFVLVAVKDTIPVAPRAFAIPPAITIQDSLNRKYANKLVPDRGLALSAFDILTAEDGRVTWGNGLMYYKVSFRLMLFAPFVGEVIVGKVLSTTKSYVRISLGFFRDIYVLPSNLPPNSAFDPASQQFFWYSDDEDQDRIFTLEELMNTVVSSRLYIDVGEPIRFRVDAVEWQDVRPIPPAQAALTNGHAINGDVEGDGAEPKPPEKDPMQRAGYKILATIAESGLGVVSWWNGQEEGDAEMEE